jgi:hypothetical protein
MTVFLRTNIDGEDAEGIGSICQWNLLLYCIAKYLGVGVSIPPFKNIAHYDYTEYSSEKWSKSFTDFFNFPYVENFDEEINFSGSYNDLEKLVKNNTKNILINIPKMFIAEHGQNNLSLFFENRYLEDIKNNLKSNENYFLKNHINISLHIRSNNPNDVDFHPSREAFLNHIDSSKFLTLIKELQNKHINDQVCLHIHSQGTNENFYDIMNKSTENFKIICHLNDHPTTDIYHMSNADYLIMANSSYSWICHLLNYNQTYVRDNFWHSVYPNAIFLDSEYIIKL